jgi:hypothetical protein
MDTFTSDYIGNGPIGITANVVNGLPREVPIPVRIPIFTSKHKEKIKEISKTIERLAILLSKVS